MRSADPERRWIIWEAGGVVIAGIYIEPSVSLAQYSALLSSMAENLRGIPAGPIVVMGDFNARLGHLAGDHFTSDRRTLTTDFVSHLSLTLLNVRLLLDETQWTWRDGLGAQSIVDVAMSSRSPCSALHVVAPPSPTCHQLLITQVAVDDAQIDTDTERWNGAPPAFVNRSTARICKKILKPVMLTLDRLWWGGGWSAAISTPNWKWKWRPVILTTQPGLRRV